MQSRDKQRELRILYVCDALTIHDSRVIKMLAGVDIPGESIDDSIAFKLDVICFSQPSKRESDRLPNDHPALKLVDIPADLGVILPPVANIWQRMVSAFRTRLLRRRRAAFVHAYAASHGYDVAVASFLQLGGAIAMLADLKPLVLLALGSDVYRIPYQNAGLMRLTKRCLEHASEVYAVTPDGYQHMQTLLEGLASPPDVRLTWITTPVSNFIFSASDRSRVRERYTIPEHAPVLLHSRGLADVYRPFDALDVIVKTCEAREDAHALIMMQGARKEEVAARVEALPEALQKRIHLEYEYLSPQDLCACYSACDLFVQTNQTDGLSLSMVEALATGMVMVTSDLEVYHTALPEEQHCVFEPVGDIDAMVRASLRLLDNVSEREAVIAAHRQVLIERFDPSCVRKNYVRELAKYCEG